MLGNTPRAQTDEEVDTGEDQDEEQSDGVDRGLLDSPLSAAAASTVNEEEEPKGEETQLDHTF